MEERNLLDDLLGWAEELKEQYENADSNADLAQVADRCIDFIDTFIERAEEI